MPNKITAIKHSIILFAYLLVVWGFYRNLFEYPEHVEEMIIKPLLWLFPVFYFLKKERLGLSSLGVTTKNLFPAIYLALILGVVFAVEGVFINYIKHGQIDFSANIGSNFIFIALLISLSTAITEELTFRGFIFNRIWQATGKEWTANFMVAVMWMLIHLPITIFRWNLGLGGIAGYLLLVGVFSIGSGFLFARTRNVTSSVLLHVLWEWPIILFR